MNQSVSKVRGFLKFGDSPSFVDEPELADKLLAAREHFLTAFAMEPSVYVRSPGRAEILGNHTDYNNGYALAASISRSIVSVGRRRGDSLIRVASDSFPGKVVEFDINNIQRDEKESWTNYTRAVIRELQKHGNRVGGADIFLGSDLPSSGGVSSSAAVELAVAVVMLELYEEPINKMEAALMCKEAENGPLVGTPCGFLDQAAVAFGESGKMVMLDFEPQPNAPFKVEITEADLASLGYSFVISVDKEVKRNLGDTGYPVRRRMCEASLPILSELLGRQVRSLREVSIAEYEDHKGALIERGGDVMRMRVEHIVYENDRVLRGARALHQKDVKGFGKILTESGRSALELYGLDEKTPELTLLVNAQRSLPGVIGSRNMGGGFSAITIALVESDKVDDFSRELNAIYQKEYGREVQCIAFRSTNGVEVL